MDKLRIGIVGLGGICRSRHVPGFRAIEGVEIVAVANRSEESTRRAAVEFGIPNVCGSWEDLVARDDVDMVVVGTWPYLHKQISIAALGAGKHVFCQARMAMNFHEALDMYDTAKATDRVAGLCPVPIGLSIDKTMARLMRERFLGDVRLVRVQGFADAYADPAAPMNWRKDERLSGLNMLTLGMFIEVMHRWFGWTRTVSAMHETFIPMRTDIEGVRREVRIPDQILFNALMEAGFPVQYAFSSVVHHGKNAIEIYGSEATLRYDVDEDTLEGARAGEPFEPVQVRAEDAYDVRNWNVERDFVAAIREGKAYHPDFEDGLRYMQVVEAVYESAAQHRTIVMVNEREIA